MFALILQRALMPMPIGSRLAWCTLAGITMRPRATSPRISSGSSCSRSATRAISGVTTPARAWCIWVTVSPVYVVLCMASLSLGGIASLRWS
jgi:hypothetical protein